MEWRVMKAPSWLYGQPSVLHGSERLFPEQKMTPLVIGFKNYRVSTFQKILSWVIKKEVEAFIASNYVTSELHLKVLKKISPNVT